MVSIFVKERGKGVFNGSVGGEAMTREFGFVYGFGRYGGEGKIVFDSGETYDFAKVDAGIELIEDIGSRDTRSLRGAADFSRGNGHEQTGWQRIEYTDYMIEIREKRRETVAVRARSCTV